MSPQCESNTRPIDNNDDKPLQSIALPTEL